MKKRYRVVSIRYNTKSDGFSNCWRIICDGNEYLTNKAIIRGEVLTTQDWIKEVGFKHHVTIENANVVFSEDLTLITNSKNGVYKDILKTITYRILGTSVTFGLGFATTQNLSIATMLGFSDLVLKPIVYFIHERLWSLKRI
jgi:uncharacterized membrane protein